MALNDAKRAIELDPKWPRGYRRKAAVLDAMKRYRDALVVYEEALAVTRADGSLSDEQKKKEDIEVKNLMAGLFLDVCYRWFCLIVDGSCSFEQEA